MPDEMNETSLPEDQNQKPENNDQGDQIPDWMKEAGWKTDTGAFDESKPVFDDLEDEDKIVPAEIPAWLEDAAPEGFSLGSDLLEDKSSALVDDDLTPISSSEDDVSDPVMKDTLPEKEELTKEDVPDIDVPSWLKNLKLDEDSQETAVAWLENMPESLRATEEEKSKAEIVSVITDGLDDLVDELEWLEDHFSDTQKPPQALPVDEAKLSEDLVASDLIPEQQEEDLLFSTDDFDTTDSDIPSWLDELGDGDEAINQPEISSFKSEESVFPQEQSSDKKYHSEDVGSLMPDWLSEIGSEEVPADEQLERPVSDPTSSSQEHVTAYPDMLSAFEEETKATQVDSDSSSLAWLESLAEKQGASEEELLSSPEEPVDAQISDEEEYQQTIPQPMPDVSSTDDTLNTEFPDWLANIGDQEKEETATKSSQDEDFDESANWLDQLADEPFNETGQISETQENSEVLEWLDGLDETSAPSPPDIKLRESLTGDLIEDTIPTEIEPESEVQSEGMPDWLGKLDTDSQNDPSSLESAIRQSDHQLSAEEVQFLDRAEEEQEDNSDWLAKLDLAEDQDQPETEMPALKVDIPEDHEEITEAESSTITGGILDRLKAPVEEAPEPEVPQWLENLKNEEDPQETAILWLKQFVKQGNKANLNDEIKRYTDELDPGDTVPKWMEDLKHEEDPQTTAMLWLEKLSGEREVQKPKRLREEPDDSGWLAELEKEAAEQIQKSVEEPTSKEFQDANEGWLADLDIDEKLKTGDEEMPDWAQSGEEEQEGETPPWMKATSPLEGDFYTDELAGSSEKEVEIPDWLAGYAEGEAPEEPAISETETEADDTSIPDDDYTWVPAGDEISKTTRELIDLNSAAISQLESIIGISYQVAKGIVTYREKHGHYKTINDLLNVPEITDEQTIEILKPEVIIREEKGKRKPPKATTPVVEEIPEKRLDKARDLIADSQINQALEHYEYLIIKKKSIDEVIEDLIKASLDHPMDVGLMKTLGDAYMRVNRLEEALDAYSKAEDLLR